MTGRDRQTVADMAVEYCGSAECVFDIARHNGIAIDAEVAGMELADEPVADRKTQEYVAGTGVSPAGMCETEEVVLVTDNSEVVVTENDETIIQ
jgi:hypothetical protein